MTLVTVPELDGIFLEIETTATTEHDMHTALSDLAISHYALNIELYTNPVAARRTHH